MSRIRVRDTHTELYGAGRGGEKSQQRKCLLVKVAFGDPQRFLARGLSQGSVFPELWTTLNTVIEHHTKSCHVRPPRLSLQRKRVNVVDVSEIVGLPSMSAAIIPHEVFVETVQRHNSTTSTGELSGKRGGKRTKSLYLTPSGRRSPRAYPALIMASATPAASVR